MIDAWSRHAAAAEAENDPPSAYPALEDAADDDEMRQPAQTTQAGDGERSLAVSAAEPDLDDWAWPSLQADLAALWPPAGLGSCAPGPGSAFSARGDGWASWAGCGGNGG